MNPIALLADGRTGVIDHGKIDRFLILWASRFRFLWTVAALDRQIPAPERHERGFEAPRAGNRHGHDPDASTPEHRMGWFVQAGAVASRVLIPVLHRVFRGPMACAMMHDIIVGTARVLLVLSVLHVIRVGSGAPEPVEANAV